MSGYTNQEDYWRQSFPDRYNFESPVSEQPNQQFEFQTSHEQQQIESYFSCMQESYLKDSQSGAMLSQCDFTKGSNGFVDEEDEPPLLEELGIDIDRIMQKTLAVLNPFHEVGPIDDINYLLEDSDLAGPVVFFLAFAAFLSIATSKAYFGYVYGLAMISFILMYILLSLMNSNSNISLSAVASVLGYCLLPVVGLACLNIFIRVKGFVGLLLAMVAIAWATLSASRFFSIICGEVNQRPLIAYPCALLYGTFTLIVIFQ